jgi:ribose/xylose/arabinose/galactoside ABC-type transport system permease subunit
MSTVDITKGKIPSYGPYAFGRTRALIIRYQYELILAGVIVLVTLALGIASNGLFWRPVNISQILVDVAITGIPAIGMTLVIITGGIDVSIGSLVGLTAAVIGVTYQAGIGAVPSILFGILAATFGGLINATLITRANVPPIITTLGALSIWRAVVYALLGGNWISNLPPSLPNIFIFDSIAGRVPYSFVGALAVILLFAWAAGKRPFFRSVYAIGNNEEAASMQGINVKRIKFVLYVFMGLLAGLAGILLLAQSPVVQATNGSGFELQVIAAVVVGGARIQGGKGTIVGSFLGALLVELVQDGVILFHIQAFWQSVVLGAMILIAVAVGLRGGKKEWVV